MSPQKPKVRFHPKHSRLQIYVILKDYNNLEECLQSEEYNVNNGSYFMSFLTDTTLFGGWTPLHISAVINDPKSAQILLKYGADINARTGTANKCSYTPLHIAIEYENEEMFQFLIQSNADINAKDSRERSPLELCIENPFMSTLLLESGADYKNPPFDKHPLIFRAIDAQNLKLVEAVVKRLRIGLYFNNRSPIQYAFDVFTKCIPLLIEAELQIHYSDPKTGDYPIHVAVRMKCFLWIRMLCEKGCNMNVSDRGGNRPLHIAAQYECSKDIALLLLSFNANPNLKNSLGLTPIHFAIENGNEELTDLLLRYKTQLSRNLSELERAIRFKRFNLASILLQRMKSIDNSIEFGFEPIIWYFVKHCVGEHNSDAKDLMAIMKKLIDMTSQVNKVNNIWGTLMHFLIFADVCTPTHCFKPLFDVLIRCDKYDINYEFKPEDTQLRNGDEVSVNQITANGTALSFALEMPNCEYYAEELIRMGADHSTINWNHVFFAPKKAKALKMLVLSGCHIPDNFREDSNPALDESIGAKDVVHYCREFDKFIDWWDRRNDTILSLKQSIRSVVRKSIGYKGCRLLATKGPQIFSPQFETFPQNLCDFILYNSYEDFEEI